MSTAAFIERSYVLGVHLDLSPERARAQPASRPRLAGLTRPQLARALVDAGAAGPEKARMRAGQVWRWMHHSGATDFSAMSNIDKATRAALAERFDLGRPEVVARQISVDGARKWLVRFEPGV